MRKLILTLTLVVGVSGVAWGAEETPYHLFVYGLVDNGNRYEQITAECLPIERKNAIQCKFNSSYIRLSKSNSSTMPKGKDLERFENEKKLICNKINSKEQKEDQGEMNLTEYDIESIDSFEKLCNAHISNEKFFSDLEEREKKTCSVSSASWEATFTKNIQGNYEHSEISELFGSGIKKAILQTIYKDKESTYGFKWNFSIEASYMGTPTDGQGVPKPYKDVYSWKKGSPLKLKCKYVTLEIL